MAEAGEDQAGLADDFGAEGARGAAVGRPEGGGRGARSSSLDLDDSLRRPSLGCSRARLVKVRPEIRGTQIFSQISGWATAPSAHPLRPPMAGGRIALSFRFNGN
jgi:hypothetical protein